MTTKPTPSTGDALPDAKAWWMIERDDMERRPMYMCEGAAWTPLWHQGQKFATKDEAEFEVRHMAIVGHRYPMFVREHAMMEAARVKADAPIAGERELKLLRDIEALVVERASLQADNARKDRAIDDAARELRGEQGRRPSITVALITLEAALNPEQG